MKFFRMTEDKLSLLTEHLVCAGFQVESNGNEQKWILHEEQVIAYITLPPLSVGYIAEERGTPSLQMLLAILKQFSTEKFQVSIFSTSQIWERTITKEREARGWR